MENQVRKSDYVDGVRGSIPRISYAERVKGNKPYLFSLEDQVEFPSDMFNGEPAILVPDALSKEGVNLFQFSLIGRLNFSGLTIHSVQKILEDQWGLGKDQCKLAPMSRGFFVIKLRTQEAKDLIWHGGKWMVGNQTLRVINFFPNFDPEKQATPKAKFVDDHLLRNRFRSSSSFSTKYIARPLEDIKVATYEQRCDTMKHADIFQSELERKSEHPSCVKSMVRSHVYSCFWLGLPYKFCESHLSMNCEKWEMVLVDEKGEEYDAIYLPKRTGLSGGWKAFALDHKLDDGDAVVLELIEPARFKVYIFRVSWDEVDAEEIKKAIQNNSVKSKKVRKSSTSTEDTDEDTSEEKVVKNKAGGRRTRNLKRIKKSETDNEDADDTMSEEKGVVDSEARGRRTHNLKRLKKTVGDSDGNMTEEKDVVGSKARGKPRNSKRAKKSDTHDVDENMSEEKGVVVDTTATGRTRNSQRVRKSAADN